MVTPGTPIALPQRKLEARKDFPGKVVEIHMDNARVHLRSKDFNPKDTKQNKAALQKYAMELCGELGGDFGSDLASATKPELVNFISTVSGRRVPEAFKVANAFGNIVERFPPFHPELNPIEHCWSQMKSGYSGRYDGSSVVRTG